MLLLLTGCLKITCTTGPALLTEPDHLEWHNRFAYGTVEVPGPYDATIDCPDGVSQVHTEVSFANQMASQGAAALGEEIGVDTTGAYTPSTITVWCEP